MKTLSIVATIFLCGFVTTQTTCAMPTSSSDMWDISQGSTVTASSSIHHHYGFMGVYGWSSDRRNMFGGYFGQSSYGGAGPHLETYFDQDSTAGTVHWVEWQTPSLMTLRSFNLVAMHGPTPYSSDISDMTQGGFSQFRLLSADTAGGPWTVVYELSDTDPDGDLYYGGGPMYTQEHYLELASNVEPTTAQYWRAEFVQYGDGGFYYPGVTVNELDGYDYHFNTTVIPAPGALILAGIGLGCVRWRRLIG